jgi:RNA polymerase sigma-70 factor (ECF subfamily)
MEPTTRHSLVLRLRDRDDEAAWTEFVAIYEPLVYGLTRRKGLQDADARDLCQEVFRAVAGAIERWDPDPAKGKFRAWLFRIARNLLVNFFADQRRHPRGTGSTSVQDRASNERTGAPSQMRKVLVRRPSRVRFIVQRWLHSANADDESNMKGSRIFVIFRDEIPSVASYS